MYKLILFDFDGTLLDSDQMLVVTFKQLYEKYKPGFHPSDDYILKFSGPQIVDTLKHEFPDLDQKMMFDEWVKYSTENYIKTTKLFPYVKEMLTSFKKNHVKYGLITSKARAATDFAIKLVGLDGLLDFSITASEVKNFKPDPEGIFLAMKHFNVLNKEEVLYVGDGIYDYETAKNAGVKFGYVTFSPRKLNPNSKIDVLIHSFKEFEKEIINEKL